MQHIIWEMYKIPFLILAFLVGLAIWIAIFAGLWSIAKWIRKNPYALTPEEEAQEEKKKEFFE